MKAIHAADGTSRCDFLRIPPGTLWHAAVAALAGFALTTGSPAEARNFCSDTAKLQFSACRSEARDDALQGRAICLNLADEEERETCGTELSQAAEEAAVRCREQRAARRELCEDLGEGRYDPGFDADDFEPDFSNPAHPNSHFPLRIGNQWRYVGGDEIIRVEVLDETKQIEGVTCAVVHDVVEQNGKIVEDTDDWYGLAKDGSVVYFGEIVKNLETFEGDDPAKPELVDIGGSFKAGRDGAKPGTRLAGSPVVGDVYREEWAVGDAEDAAEILSTTYGYGDDPELDEFVPQGLALRLCDHDCIVTGNFTPLEPDALERKYYAPGIGTFLEVHPESGDVVQLVDCSFHPDCAALPAP